MAILRDFVKAYIHENPMPLFKGPLFVIMHFRLPTRKSYTRTKRARFHTLPHFKRPDGDNLEKYLNDALRGIVWDDDSKITWLFRSKTLTDEDEGQTILFVREIEDGKPNYEQMISDIKENIILS